MPADARGFTMLEVLVAILVVTLGLLGLAGLQTVSLRNNTSSAQRTIATQLAYDMSDRMRANWAAVLAGDYDYRNYNDRLDGRTITPAPKGATTANCMLAAGCNPQLLAYEDIWEWNQQICAQLPQSSGCADPAPPGTVGPWGVVCLDSTPTDGTPAAPQCDGQPNSPYVIKIWWIEDRNNPALPLKLWTTTFVP